MKLNCAEHGNIKIIGRPIKYCPICGEKTYPIFLIPKIYIDKVVIIPTIILIVLFSSVYGAIRYDNAHLVQMDAVWKILYFEMKSLWAKDEIKTVQTFVDNNKDYLQNHPASPDEIELIIDEVDSDNRGTVSQIISPYESKK